MQHLRKNLPNILIIVFLAFGIFAGTGGVDALSPEAQKQGDGTPFVQLSPGEGEIGLNPDDVWLTWANYEATEFWKYSYCIASEGAYLAGACGVGDPNWTGTYNRQYVHMTNLQPNTMYYWRVKVVRCEVSDCTEKEHIVSHSDFFSFETGNDNWLKVSGKAGNKSGILVNFYDSGDNKTYSILTGSNGHYTISVRNGFTGTAYPRMDPQLWVYGDPIYDTRFTPAYRFYDFIDQNLYDQDFVLKDLITISGKTNGVAGVTIEFEYKGQFFDENGIEIISGDPAYDQLLASYTFTTYSNSAGEYQQSVPKNWLGIVKISEDYEGTNPYAPSETINFTNFDPWYYSVPQLLANKTGLNFYLNQVKISGHTDNLSGIAVTFTGTGDFVGEDYSVESDANGYYYQYVSKGWQGLIEVETPVTVGDTDYYFSPTTYSLNPVFTNSYGWSFFKTKIAP